MTTRASSSYLSGCDYDGNLDLSRVPLGSLISPLLKHSHSSLLFFFNQAIHLPAFSFIISWMKWRKFVEFRITSGSLDKLLPGIFNETFRSGKFQQSCKILNCTSFTSRLFEFHARSLIVTLYKTLIHLPQPWTAISIEIKGNFPQVSLFIIRFSSFYLSAVLPSLKHLSVDVNFLLLVLDVKNSRSTYHPKLWDFYCFLFFFSFAVERKTKLYNLSGLLFLAYSGNRSKHLSWRQVGWSETRREEKNSNGSSSE